MVVESCKHYLRGVKCELVTDSTVVAALLKRDAPARHMNLILRLSEYDFTIVHRKSNENRNANFMSRWVLEAKQTYTDWKQTQGLSAVLDAVLIDDVEAKKKRYRKFNTSGKS